jgi:hypothetical protein
LALELPFLYHQTWHPEVGYGHPAEDLRFALRQLRKSPGFSIAAVLTVAMAIGSNSVVFSVMNGLILRPLDVPQAQSLYGIERASDKDASQSYPNHLDLRDRNRSFDGKRDSSQDKTLLPYLSEAGVTCIPFEWIDVFDHKDHSHLDESFAGYKIHPRQTDLEGRWAPPADSGKISCISENNVGKICEAAGKLHRPLLFHTDADVEPTKWVEHDQLS